MGLLFVSSFGKAVSIIAEIIYPLPALTQPYCEPTQIFKIGLSKSMARMFCLSVVRAICIDRPPYINPIPTNTGMLLLLNINLKMEDFHYH